MSLPRSGARWRSVAARILVELFLGRGDELAALARALGRQFRVATDDEPLAGVVVGGDFRHVALVEERELQRSALGGQSLDGRSA